MNAMRIIAVWVFVIVSCLVPAFAWGCDEVCKPGEYYSDKDEMCVPLDKPSS